MDQQQALQYAKGLTDKGMTVADANVALVRMEGIRIVKARMPRDVRAALMAGVVDGRLGHLPKDGLKPEAFFHPNSIWKAKEARQKEENTAVRAIAAICG
ncbi:MAG: hypothetical protein LW713_17940 [Acetobacteraceae bacterium]|jgi:hypothetical protein|nr:hypothetical protein [Acetobacteraceae bacterium]